MWRGVLSVVVGVLAWFALVTLGNLALRDVWPAYAAADGPQMSYDLAMKIARLAMSTVALVLAGAGAQWIARGSRNAAIGFGVAMLLIFVPIHYQLWPKFPIWYHLTFLSSLLLLPLAAWSIMGARARDHSGM